tara:strand:- start:288 stop:686 length:399 start_codon:yes stop_codon:yes gene_type:complete
MLGKNPAPFLVDDADSVNYVTCSPRRGASYTITDTVNMNLVELGESTDCEYSKEHVCLENDFPKFDRVLHCLTSFEETLDEWQLHCLHYADEQEVELGEAEYVDEVTYHSMISISYCPFCGVNLLEHEAAGG